MHPGDDVLGWAAEAIKSSDGSDGDRRLFRTDGVAGLCDQDCPIRGGMETHPVITQDRYIVGCNDVTLAYRVNDLKLFVGQWRTVIPTLGFSTCVWFARAPAGPGTR